MRGRRGFQRENFSLTYNRKIVFRSSEGMPLTIIRHSYTNIGRREGLDLV